MYYVRREGRIKGPLTREKLSRLRRERRLRMRDEVSESPEGPWRTLRDVRGEVLGGDEGAGPFGGGLPIEEPVEWPTDDEDDAIDATSDESWHESLQTWLEGEDPFRRPFRPWMYVLGALFLVALAGLTLAIVLGTH